MSFAKRFMTGIAGLVVVLAGSSATAWAAEAAEGVTSASGDSIVLVAIFITSGIGVAIAAVGAALGQGQAVKAACEGMARNPGMAGKLQVAMIIGLAMMESLAIYALLISLILLFGFAGKFM